MVSNFGKLAVLKTKMSQSAELVQPLYPISWTLLLVQLIFITFYVFQQLLLCYTFLLLDMLSGVCRNVHVQWFTLYGSGCLVNNVYCGFLTIFQYKCMVRWPLVIGHVHHWMCYRGSAEKWSSYDTFHMFRYIFCTRPMSCFVILKRSQKVNGMKAEGF